MDRRSLWRIARTTAVLSLSVAGTAAALSGGRALPVATDGPVLRASGGALRLDSSRPHAAVLGGRNLGPGQTVSGAVTLTASGTSRTAVTLMLSDLVEDLGPQGGRLSEWLQLRIVEERRKGPQVLRYLGPLGGLNRRPLGIYDAGESRTYHFTATLPDSPESQVVQGASATASFLWLAEELPATAKPRPIAPLRLRLVLPVRQHPRLRRGTLIGWVTCSRPCTLRPAGRARGAALRAVAVPRQAGRRPVRITLRLPAAAQRALRRRVALRATVTVRGTDTAGHTAKAGGRTRLLR